MSPFHSAVSYRSAYLPSRVRQAIAGGEGPDCDFKESCYESGQRQNCLVDITSFANANGGLIILGVIDQKRRSGNRLAGVTDGDKACDRIRDWLNAGIEPSLPNVNIERIDIDGVELVVIDIPKSTSGPIGVASGGGHGFHIRDGDRNRRMKLSELRRAFRSEPASSLQRECKSVLDQFSSVAHSGDPVQLCIGSPQSNTDSDAFDFITKYRAISANTNFGSMMIRTPKIIHYENSPTAEIDWPLGTWINLDEDMKPICVRLPPLCITTVLRTTNEKTLDRYCAATHAAGRLVANYRNEFIDAIPPLADCDELLRTHDKSWIWMAVLFWSHLAEHESRGLLPSRMYYDSGSGGYSSETNYSFTGLSSEMGIYISIDEGAASRSEMLLERIAGV